MAVFLRVVLQVFVGFSIASMNGLCLGLSGTAISIGKVALKSTETQSRSYPVRCFSKLDDFMEDVEDLMETLASQNATTMQKNEGWKGLDLSGLVLRETKPSPVEEKLIQGRRVFIKRDDLLRLHGSQISGNKARKMLAMNEIPTHDFPGCLVSYGGPQSNSMLALAALVNYKNREAEVKENPSVEDASSFGIGNDMSSQNRTKRFVYYTKKLPRFLRNQPSGNLYRAKTLGMEIKELSQQEYGDLFGGDYGGSPTPPLGLSPPVVGDSLWVCFFKLISWQCLLLTYLTFLWLIICWFRYRKVVHLVWHQLVPAFSPVRLCLSGCRTDTVGHFRYAFLGALARPQCCCTMS